MEFALLLNSTNYRKIGMVKKPSIKNREFTHKYRYLFLFGIFIIAHFFSFVNTFYEKTSKGVLPLEVVLFMRFKGAAAVCAAVDIELSALPPR